MGQKCFNVYIECVVFLVQSFATFVHDKNTLFKDSSSVFPSWRNYSFFPNSDSFYFGCRVNKPYLPIAAGDLSVQSAWFLVLLFAVAGLLIVAANFGPFITSLYCLGLFLGTIYSVPPFRMKRFPVLAFLIIATV